LTSVSCRRNCLFKRVHPRLTTLTHTAG